MNRTYDNVLTDPQERPVALSKSEGKTKSSLLKGKKIDE